MALEKMTENVEIVQTLSTYPNQEDGLSAEELKAKFDAGAKALKEYLNGQVVPAVQELERVVDPGMAYGLDPTLSVPGRAADAGAVGTALAGKAPAGYGLGAWAKHSSDFNNELITGWYATASTSTANSPFKYAVMHVIKRNDEMCVQVAYDISPSSSSAHAYGAIAIRRQYVDTFSEWEWVNPPMALGVEYRTTERWNGKVKYTTLVNCGNLPAAGEKTVSVLPASYKIIHCEGCTTDGWAMPVISDGDCRVTAFGSSVRFAATRDFSWMSANVTLWYTKD